MATTKFTPPAVPFDASPDIRRYLDEQMRRLSVLVNNAVMLEDVAGLSLAASQITSGTFADARIAQSNVTQHQAALSIAETQITDGSILARVVADEIITGAWSFSGNPVVLTDDSQELRFGDGNDLQIFADGASGRYNTSGWHRFSVGGTEVFRIEGGQAQSWSPLFLVERAVARGSTAGLGQLWVKNTTPCQLWFTDDAGTDTRIV